MQIQTQAVRFQLPDCQGTTAYVPASPAAAFPKWGLLTLAIPRTCLYGPQEVLGFGIWNSQSRNFPTRPLGFKPADHSFCFQNISYLPGSGISALRPSGTRGTHGSRVSQHWSVPTGSRTMNPWDVTFSLTVTCGK